MRTIIKGFLLSLILISTIYAVGFSSVWYSLVGGFTLPINEDFLTYGFNLSGTLFYGMNNITVGGKIEVDRLSIDQSSLVRDPIVPYLIDGSDLEGATTLTSLLPAIRYNMDMGNELILFFEGGLGINFCCFDYSMKIDGIEEEILEEEINAITSIGLGIDLEYLEMESEIKWVFFDYRPVVLSTFLVGFTF